MNAPRKILSGMFYTLGGAYTGRLFSFFAGTVLLPRLIDPGTWGIFILGAALFLVLISFKELGLSFALLHYQERLEELASTHFLFNLLVATCCSGLIILFAIVLQNEAVQALIATYVFPKAADVENYRLVVLTLIILAVFSLFRSTAHTSETRLRIRLEFKPLALINMLGIVLSLSVAVLLAWRGFGIWALILGGTASYVVHSPVYIVVVAGLIWKRQPQRLKGLCWNRDHAQLLWQYGRWFWCGWIFSILIIEFPKIVTGFFLGWEALGYYALAFTWAQLPTGAITQVLTSLTNPVYARYQRDRERLSMIYGKMLRLIARTTALPATVFYLEAERLIPLLSGPQWAPSISLLRWMVIYALFRPFLDDIHALFSAVGTPRTVARINGIQAGIALAGMPLLVLGWGLNGAAFGLGITAVVGVGLSFYYVRRYVDVSWGGFRNPALSIVLTVAVMSFLEDLLPGPGLSGLAVRLGLEGFVYIAGLLVLEGRELYQEVVEVRRILLKKEVA